ncbi:PAS domain-containing hybrid sensor histidine kinase/response regulator [Aquabacterium humicola]|uniref:PAS domain-containing hybrid sensor histidine kinase/response regulator n=1 Tax=Aquabacterium humicola TaxID=3237377 RepID=UPI002543E499|nr:PAS domain S-box protein [Rubrivivax pictus]
MPTSGTDPLALQSSIDDGQGAGGRAGVALQATDERYRQLVESVVDYAIFLLDTDGRVATWNLGAERIKGWRADEIIGRSFETFYPPDVAASGWPREELRRASAEGRFEDEGWRVRKDGTRFWASVVITALRDAQGALQGFSKVTRDLTERRLHEQALQQSEEQLRLMVESVRDYAIFMLDPDGHVLTWNAGAAAIKGYAADEVLLRDFSMFFTAADIAAGKPQQELRTALRDGRAETQGWRVRRDGTLFWASVMITPVRSEDGRLRGFAKVTRDLTAQRRLLELEHASQRTNEFIAMLAHELRNPLAPIRNAANVLQLQPALPAAALPMCRIIERQVGHLTRLVDDLLDVGRIVNGKIAVEQVPLDYRDVVLASVDVIRPLADERRQLLLLGALPPALPMRGDPTRLAQALQNLLHNAVRYTPEGGEVRVIVRVEGASCVTTVTDNGVGIAAPALERIFDLFHQEPGAERQPSQSGLGIGLSLARSLVEQHGGMLSAHSEGLGRGSSFTMVLPLREPAADLPATAVDAVDTAAPAPATATRRVLVVDDNRDATDTMLRFLQLLGHPARGAYDGDEALAAAETFAPELVLLDLNMPGSDGFAVLRRLRERGGAAVYIAAMTGYGQAGDRRNTGEAGFQAHLTKPVGAEQLLEVLRAAADARWQAAPG